MSDPCADKIGDVVREAMRRALAIGHKTAWAGGADVFQQDGVSLPFFALVTINTEKAALAEAVFRREGLLCDTDLGVVNVNDMPTIGGDSTRTVDKMKLRAIHPWVGAQVLDRGAPYTIIGGYHPNDKRAMQEGQEQHARPRHSHAHGAPLPPRDRARLGDTGEDHEVADGEHTPTSGGRAGELRESASSIEIASSSAILGATLFPTCRYWSVFVPWKGWL